MCTILRESAHSHNFYYSTLLSFYFTISCCCSSLAVPGLWIKLCHRRACIETNMVCIRFSTCYSLRHPLRSWNISPPDDAELLLAQPPFLKGGGVAGPLLFHFVFSTGREASSTPSCIWSSKRKMVKKKKKPTWSFSLKSETPTLDCFYFHFWKEKHRQN